jgi:hypothetical protein
VLASRTPPRQTREPSSPEEEEVDQEIVDETLDVGLESAAVLDEGENSEEEETEEEEDEF